MYERLSHDDELSGESNSIVNQKKLLRDYANRHKLGNPTDYSDDGYSGTRWDRPGFMKLMEEIEGGRVENLVIKDMSRIGRDYLRVGLFMEKLREKNVRLISINDNLDTSKGEDDFIPFRNIIHEWYARDASRKTRSALMTRGTSGEHTCTTPPYGYVKSAEDKGKWEVDPEAAEIVRRVFRMSLEGRGPWQICRILEAEKILMPGAYQAARGLGFCQKREFENPYRWHAGTITTMLKRKEYMGHTVNFRTRRESYKDRYNRPLPEEEWLIFENTQEAIIDRETFDNVQRLRSNTRRRPDKSEQVHPLTGLLYCADCGGKLYVRKEPDVAVSYACSNYSKYYKACETAHRVAASKVTERINEAVRGVIEYARKDASGFERSVREALATQRDKEARRQAARLGSCRRRASDLDVLTRKIYEDNALGKLTDERYEALYDGYEEEQKSLEREIGELELAVAAQKSGVEKAARFIELVKRYREVKEIDVVATNEFVERVVVHERERKGCFHTEQCINIHFNHIGLFTVPEPEPEASEVAAREEAKRLLVERQEKQRRAYLARKARRLAETSAATP